MIDLDAELRAASEALTHAAVMALHRRFGVPRAVCARLVPSGAVGLASMTIEAGGSRWTPGGPDRRLVIAVYDLVPQAPASASADLASGAGAPTAGRPCGPVGPEAMSFEYGLIDVVAVASHDPQEWALRTGAGVMLGAEALIEVDRAAMAERTRALRVFSNPIEWLAGCRPDGNGLAAGGVCMVEIEAGVRALRQLGERCTLVVDRGARERMRAMLAYGGLPRVCEAAEPLGVAA